jgi:hypothetical protein
MKLGRNPAQSFSYQIRVPTQVEEVINDPDAIQFQHFGKNNSQILFLRKYPSPEYRAASQGTIKQ